MWFGMRKLMLSIASRSSDILMLADDVVDPVVVLSRKLSLMAETGTLIPHLAYWSFPVYIVLIAAVGLIAIQRAVRYI